LKNCWPIMGRFASIRLQNFLDDPRSTEVITKFVRGLSNEWSRVAGRREPLALRKKRRILEAYERPSWVTNEVKRQRGDACQLCGVRGFVKRDGERYCEVHHLFHLADEPPDDCLSAEHVVVLCVSSPSPNLPSRGFK
jgi:hypothetical protein